MVALVSIETIAVLLVAFETISRLRASVTTPSSIFFESLALVVSFYGLTSLLCVLLPAYKIAGYVCDFATGKPLEYRLNGPLLLAAVVIMWYGAPINYASFAALHLWECVAAANALGLVCALLLVLCFKTEQPFRCLTCDQKDLCERAANGEDVQQDMWPTPKRNVFAHYFFGVAFNPRLLGVDLKMQLYAVGAAALAWNALSAASLRLETVGSLSTAMLLYLSLLFWFLFEYMIFESVHLYTYDLFCEKTGFKICWGCLVFYPFFYCVGVWPLVDATVDLDATACYLIVALFGCGYALTRGANLQKFLFKRYGHATFALGLITNEVVPGTRLLCTGFWGLSRHVNYAGEILQATALALPGSLVATSAYGQLLPWLYPLYYVALFVPRQMDDDEQMRLKYGQKAFDAYVKKVPSRIVPGLW